MARNRRNSVYSHVLGLGRSYHLKYCRFPVHKWHSLELSGCIELALEKLGQVLSEDISVGYLWVSCYRDSKIDDLMNFPFEISISPHALNSDHRIVRLGKSLSIFQNHSHQLVQWSCPTETESYYSKKKIIVLITSKEKSLSIVWSGLCGYRNSTSLNDTSVVSGGFSPDSVKLSIDDVSFRSCNNVDISVILNQKVNGYFEDQPYSVSSSNIIREKGKRVVRRIHYFYYAE